jgi:hypothetical protein
MPEGNIKPNPQFQEALASAQQKSIPNLGNVGYFPTARPGQVGIGYRDMNGNSYAGYVGNVNGLPGVGGQYSGNCVIM